MVIGYLVAQVALGVWLSRKIADQGDFFLAGRSLGIPLVSFSLFATWFGAETCIGTSGAVFADGLSGSRADPIGYGLCLLLMGVFLAGKLWHGGYRHLGDFFRLRYGGKTETIAIWLLNLASLFWAAAQLRAFGQVIASTTTLPVTPAIIISAGIVIAYTLLGGLLGDIITDMIQGIVIALGLAWLGWHAYELWTQVPHVIAPERLRLIPSDQSIWIKLDRWMIPILGSLVTQELAARLLASRSATVARQASFVACGIYLAVGSIPVALGLIGPTLIPSLAEPEQFLMTFAELHLPEVAFAAFAGALLSAMLATIDSILLAVAALFSDRVPLPKRFSQEPDRGRVFVARALVFVAGAVATVLALTSDGIYTLVEFASSFGTSGILVVTLGGLYGKWADETTARITLVVGVILPLAGEHLFGWQAPFLSAVLLTFLVYFSLGWYRRLSPAG